MPDEIIVVGGGASGLLAAAYAAAAGRRVLLVEKNAILGKKIRISGKGRCNVTSAIDIRNFIAHYPGNGKFLYSAFHTFTNHDLLQLLSQFGVATKVERGNRIFPVSDDADQIVECLIKNAKQNGVKFALNTHVEKVIVEDNQVIGVVTNHGKLTAKKVIITTGGASYPRTGSNGDGYRIAKAIGHSVIKPFPALVGLKTHESWVEEVSGLSLRNIEVTLSNGTKQETLFGEMQFAHFGVTGPVILTLSRQAGLWLEGGDHVSLSIDLKPALSEAELDARIQRDFLKYNRKQYKNSLGDLLPKSLIPVFIELSQIDPEKSINQVTKKERLHLVRLLKQLPLSISATLPLSTAIVTAGGVDVTEINPKTMESKLIDGLYFAGEVIDIDGVTGGFNLQAAFSTGVLAGISASKS